jgi:hypothetical protein
MNRTPTCGPALLVTLTASVVLCACGGGSGGTTGGGSGGSTTGGGTSGGGTAGKAYEGSVILSEIVGASTSYGAVAVFKVTVASSTCQGGTPSGSCCYEPPPSSTGGVPTLVSAGGITVVDSGATIGTLTFTSGYYILSGPTSTFTWKPGDSLTVSAAGATVDSFSETVTAPGTISGLNPTLSTTPTDITLSSNWSLSWTPDARGGETMIVALTDETVANGEISCSVQDSAGTVTLPATLLGNFTPGHMARLIATRLSVVHPNDSNTQVNLVAGVEVGGSAKFK